MKKIGISGVHGAGKSYKTAQFYLEFKEKYPTKRIELLRENIINCPYPINEGTTAEAQGWIFAEQLHQELTFGANPKVDFLITDRTIFDTIVYAQYAGFTELSKRMKKLAECFIDTYEMIYLIDGSKHKYIYQDGLRSVEENYRNMINQGFFFVFDELKRNNPNFRYEVI